MFPIDVLRFSEFRTMRNHLSETLMLNDIQITSEYMSRWVVLERRVGAVTSQRVLKVLFYVNILPCFFVVEHFTANAVSVAIGDNGNCYAQSRKYRDKTYLYLHPSTTHPTSLAHSLDFCFICLGRNNKK
jgi:hypothetical protein